MKGDAHLVQTLPTNGIYTLIIFLSRDIHINIGKLGKQKFPKGYYTYTGSALGKRVSNLKRRVLRHLQKEKRNFWHIDFLLANENATVTAVVAAQTNRKLECNLNRHIKSEGEAKIPVKKFGASDCRENCESHLLYFGEENIESKIVTFYSRRFGSEHLIVETLVKNCLLAPKVSNPSSIEYQEEVEWTGKPCQ